MKDVFRIASSALPEDTRVAGFRAAEALSRPYAIDLYLLVNEDDQELAIADAVGAKATLTLDRDDDRPPFVFHGLLESFALLHEMDGRALFHATLVPQLWQLSQNRHSRIFTGKTIPEIIASVLEDAGLLTDDYVFRLSHGYRPEEHVCQYQESDLDFISRWMEREGMYYYFEQGTSGEKVVITDNRGFHEGLTKEPVRYRASLDDRSAGAALQGFTCRHRSLAASVRVRDYDYGKPTLEMSGAAPVSNIGNGEINLHGARFFSPDEGKRIAKVRAEELLARQVVYQGSGTAFHLRPGYTFSLQDHPRISFEGDYLVTELVHEGNQTVTTPELRRLTGLHGDDVYRVELTAIPASVQFRARSETPWPRIYGSETGTICGPADSEYAQIDDHGRYNVKFKFDESDLKDGKASTWVRMLQPHGGTVEGWHFPLRKGTEVLFTFLGGDPDRPVIAGVVPNAHTPSPVTRGNHTANVIQTGGRNRIELEDKAGNERITISTPYANTYIRMGAPNAQHELIVKTDKNALLDTKQNWDVWIGGTLKERVKGKVEETYQDDLVHMVEGKTNLVHHEDYTFWTGGEAQETYTKKLTRTLTDELEQTVSKEATLSFDDEVELKIKGETKVTVDDEVKIKIKKDVNIEYNKWESTAHGEETWTAFKNQTHANFANRYETTYGVRSDIHFGFKNDMAMVSSADTRLGVYLDTKVGFIIETALAGKTEIGGTCHMHQVPTKISQAASFCMEAAAFAMWSGWLMIT